MTHAGTRALEDILLYGKALVKHLSPNDVGKTGSHQSGYFLPKGANSVYTNIKPEKGVNNEESVRVLWQDGRETDSRIKWYGASKDEYRLTRLGHDFPWRTEDSVGDLLVLIPDGPQHFLGYVLDHPDDIENLKAALGIEDTRSWEIVDRALTIEPSTGEECVDDEFRQRVCQIDGFPTGDEMSQMVTDVVFNCFKDFGLWEVDKRLLYLVDSEYSFFKMIERKLCGPDVIRLFKSVDEFVSIAMSIVNRRKTRAGRSLENHVEALLKESAIVFEMRPAVDGKPDILVPGKDAYLDTQFPTDKLLMAGIKTTCKDRWGQVLKEAKRVSTKYLITTQQGISVNQVKDMKDAGILLVVPKPLHGLYPKTTDLKPLSLSQFIDIARNISH